MNIIQEYEKETIYSYYKIYENKINTNDSFNIENFNYIDNKEIVDELTKSTPFIVNKEVKINKKNLVEFKYISENRHNLNLNGQVLQYFKLLNQQSKQYIIEFDDSKQVLILFGKLSEYGFVLITKDISGHHESIKQYNEFLTITFLFILFVALILTYALYQIKSYHNNKIYLEQELSCREEDMRLIAFKDTLTGVATRLKFNEALKDLIGVAKRFDQKFVLILFDIDHFKTVNDTYGHDYGDYVLRKVSKNVKKSLRSADTFARWGGEEFVILLPMTTLTQGVQIAQKLRIEVSELKFNKLNNITCSFGVVEFKNLHTEKSILKEVDNLLYEAKKSGRNCVKF